MALSQDTVDNFIFDTVLVQPIEKILIKLDKNEFRDCDIKWLDSKLKDFTSFAAETFGIKNVIEPQKEPFPLMNAYVQNYYTERFIKLLDYFKSFK